MQHEQVAPRERGQRSAVLRPWHGDNDRAQASAPVVTALIVTTRSLPRLEVEHAVGGGEKIDACDGTDGAEVYEGAAAPVELAGAAIALGDTGHEPVEPSPKRAGSPGVHQVVNDRECRLACSKRDVSEDNLGERLNLVVVIHNYGSPQQRAPFALLLECANRVGHGPQGHLRESVEAYVHLVELVTVYEPANAKSTGAVGEKRCHLSASRLKGYGTGSWGERTFGRNVR